MLKICKELGIYFTISSLLEWDSQTYLPSQGDSFRGDQLGFLEEKIIQIMTNSETKSIIEKLSVHKNELDNFETRNFDLFNKAFSRRTAVPSDLLIENKKQESITFGIWKKAKKENNFKLFIPELEKNIAFKRKIASFLDPEKIPFDVFLDEFEPGITSTELEKIFNNLKTKLISLLQKIQSHDNKSDAISKLNFSLGKLDQQILVKEITKFIGFDIERGSIDQGEHPMTLDLGPDDVRFTVNYNNENNYISALFAGLHEAGHAIHGQNISKEFIYYPVNLFGSSAGISESQSRFFENIIGRSESFWKYYYPKLQRITHQNISINDFLFAINKVQLSKIRIHADEVTYPLHIILRFEIEKGMLDGSYEVSELPSIWNEKFEKYFGFEITNDSEGILQDVHWASGFYGYFPSYALGNLYNSQMYYAMKKELEFDSLLANGSVQPIKNWLTDRVHKKTGFYNPLDFINKITSEELNPNYFIRYLEEKYSKLYSFS